MMAEFPLEVRVAISDILLLLLLRRRSPRKHTEMPVVMGSLCLAMLTLFQLSVEIAIEESNTSMHEHDVDVGCGFQIPGTFQHVCCLLSLSRFIKL